MHKWKLGTVYGDRRYVEPVAMSSHRGPKVSCFWLSECRAMITATRSLLQKAVACIHCAAFGWQSGDRDTQVGIGS